MGLLLQKNNNNNHNNNHNNNNHNNNNNWFRCRCASSIRVVFRSSFVGIANDNPTTTRSSVEICCTGNGEKPIRHCPMPYNPWSFSPATKPAVSVNPPTVSCCFLPPPIQTIRCDSMKWLLPSYEPSRMTSCPSPLPFNKPGLFQKPTNLIPTTAVSDHSLPTTQPFNDIPTSTT